MTSKKPRKTSTTSSFRISPLELLITICARGGSKGVPRKNIRPLMGRPLIHYTIDAARTFAARYGADLGLSTDDNEILQVAREAGLDTDYIRPAHLATDAAGKIDTILDLLLHYEAVKGRRYDYVLDMDVTSPLRTQQDLEAGFRIIQEDPSALNLFSVSKAKKNPYYDQVERQESGYYTTCKKGGFKSRQTAPEVFEMNASFYFYRRRFFSEGLKSATTDASLVYVMPHVCFDIDYPADFDFLEFLVTNDRIPFKL